jgi:hypothetical protein
MLIAEIRPRLMCADKAMEFQEIGATIQERTDGKWDLLQGGNG